MSLNGIIYLFIIIDKIHSTADTSRGKTSLKIYISIPQLSRKLNTFLKLLCVLFKLF